ncbi:DUF859 family phage minor structural protein [Senegalia massiliensis]|uniref:Uncharacterized protein n=1 Tax=Senegalia massiliensis TaxID=1720316 RepID=A0A845R1B5_9CLOT|nr:DUF859 family phage minor structural protein [Senegalia massiliensis]NBI08054.1 hypothetical protein [Senegalia massiliensis]
MATLTWNPGINSYSPYVKLYVTQKSQSISGNYTILEYSLKLYRPRQVYSSASKSYNIKINGTTVKSGSTTIGGSGTKTIASGTTKVYHNSNGTKKNVAISFYQEVSITWSGVATGNASKSGTMDLTTIPRYAKITSLYANNIRGTQFKINYATDKTIDNVDYSLNGGSWQDTHNSSNYFYITGLKPGTRYTVKIRVRSKDSGLWTTSGTITITTVGLSTSNEPDFDTDGNLTINISRKSTSMYHDLYLYFWHDEQRWEEIARISNVTTKGIFNFTSTQLNEIYNGRVQSNKSNTRLKIVSKWGSNGTVQGTTYEYGELTIVNANPSIDGVTYKDTDTNVQAILNNDQLILRNKSYLEVTAGTASSQKGATLKSYKLSIGGNEYSIATSGTSETGKKIYWGPLDQSSNQTAVLTVIDSRGNKASRSFTIQVINYYEPEPVNYSADRLNNYEESSYINAELRRSVVNINGNDINELYIRYSVESGSTTSATGNNSHKNGIWQHVDLNEFIGDHPNDKSFSVYLEIKDKFSNWLTITMELPEGIALLSFLKDKIKVGVPFENLAIGKSHEGNYELEVGGNIEASKNMVVREHIYIGDNINPSKIYFRFPDGNIGFESTQNYDNCVQMYDWGGNGVIWKYQKNTNRFYITKNLTVSYGCDLQDRLNINGYIGSPVHINRTTNRTLDLINATPSSNDVWNSKYNSNLLIENYNNALSFIVGGTSNDRIAMIQVGHSAEHYAQHLGELRLNPLGGRVKCGDDVYVTGNMSAQSITDRTPFFIGDALSEIVNIKSDQKGSLDHNTLPDFVRKRIKIKKSEVTGEIAPRINFTRFEELGIKISEEDLGNEVVEEEARDIGGMISLLTVAIQQLNNITKQQQKEINRLMEVI